MSIASTRTLVNTPAVALHASIDSNENIIPQTLTRQSLQDACRRILKTTESRASTLVHLFERWWAEKNERLVDLRTKRSEIIQSLQNDQVLHSILFLVSEIGYRQTEDITRIARGTLYRYSTIAREIEGNIEIHWVMSAKTNQCESGAIAKIQNASRQLTKDLAEITNTSLRTKHGNRLSQRNLQIRLRDTVNLHLDELERITVEAIKDESLSCAIKTQLMQSSENAQNFAVAVYEIASLRPEYHPAIKRDSSQKVLEICAYTLGQLDNRATKIPSTEGFHLRCCAEHIVRCNGTLDNRGRKELAGLAQRFELPKEVIESNMAITLKRATDILRRVTKNQDHQKSTRDGTATLEEVAELMTSDREQIKELQERAFAKLRKKCQNLMLEIGLRPKKAFIGTCLPMQEVEEDVDHEEIRNLTTQVA